jgi:predicted RND superfamily exporter protein
MLGFVILIGTVVNNPILIVHQSLNHMREDGMPPHNSILESVRTRIRPIFMTTLTTVLGLLPLVLFPGAGSELYRGLGSVVLGGLLVSTVFTLILVPTLFSLTMDAKAFLVRLLFGEHVAITERGVEKPVFRALRALCDLVGSKSRRPQSAQSNRRRTSGVSARAVPLLAAALFRWPYRFRSSLNTIRSATSAR